MQTRHVLWASAAITLLALCGSAASLAAGSEPRKLKGHTAGVTAVAFSSDGKALASGSADATVKLWDVQSGRLLTNLAGHQGAVMAVAFSPDGKTLASGSSDAEVMLWDLATGKAPVTLVGHSAKVKCLAFSSDGAWLASGSADKTIRLWNAKTGQLKTTLEGHSRGVLCVAFAPGGKTLASGSADENVKIWNVERGCEETPAPFERRGKRGPIVSLAFSADGGNLATVTPQVVEAWELAPPRRQSTFKGKQKGSVWWSARYSPQGMLWAIGSGVKYAHAIRVSTKQGLSTGSYQSKNNEISLWDAKTGRELRRFGGHREAVKAVDLAPDGTRLASGGGDKTVMLWEVDRCTQPQDEPPASDGEPAEASLVAGDDDQPQDAKILRTFAEFLCLDPTPADCWQPEDLDPNDACANEIVAWLCGGGSLSRWDDVRLTPPRKGTPRPHAPAGKGDKEKTPPSSTALLRFAPYDAKSSWIGYRENVEPRVSKAADSHGGDRSFFHAGDGSPPARDFGHREEGFWSRAGKSFDAVSHGGGGGRGEGGGKGDEGHKDKK